MWGLFHFYSSDRKTGVVVSPQPPPSSRWSVTPDVGAAAHKSPRRIGAGPGGSGVRRRGCGQHNYIINEQATHSCHFVFFINKVDKTWSTNFVKYANPPLQDQTCLGRCSKNPKLQKNNNPVHKKQQVVRVTSRMQFPSSLLGVAREVEMF